MLTFQRHRTEADNDSSKRSRCLGFRPGMRGLTRTTRPHADAFGLSHASANSAANGLYDVHYLSSDGHRKSLGQQTVILAPTNLIGGAEHSPCPVESSTTARRCLLTAKASDAEEADFPERAEDDYQKFKKFSLAVTHQPRNPNKDKNTDHCD